MYHSEFRIHTNNNADANHGTSCPSCDAREEHECSKVIRSWQMANKVFISAPQKILVKNSDFMVKKITISASQPQAVMKIQLHFAGHRCEKTRGFSKRQQTSHYKIKTLPAAKLSTCCIPEVYWIRMISVLQGFNFTCNSQLHHGHIQTEQVQQK
jgi:hypothetical protein